MSISEDRFVLNGFQRKVAQAIKGNSKITIPFNALKTSSDNSLVVIVNKNYHWDIIYLQQILPLRVF